MKEPTWPAFVTFPQMTLFAASLRSVFGSMNTGDLPPSYIHHLSDQKTVNTTGYDHYRNERRGGTYLGRDGRERLGGSGEDDLAYAGTTGIQHFKAEERETSVYFLAHANLEACECERTMIPLQLQKLHPRHTQPAPQSLSAFLPIIACSGESKRSRYTYLRSLRNSTVDNAI